jgi:hypothetical protein
MKIIFIGIQNYIFEISILYEYMVLYLEGD